jgi:hypothetical protein
MPLPFDLFPLTFSLFLQKGLVQLMTNDSSLVQHGGNNYPVEKA